MSLYLKYRPKDFDSLVGQDFIRDTLKAAIAQNNLVGAYLFTGPRGTGKTSTARIFANALNCLQPENGNPCGVCDICKQAQENKLIDIIEIDAASYTGVDNIRDIIEKAQFSPNKSKYKVYIIDEVHMLSKGAFNALLKILEEPPKHVKFILATTEIHKVLDTIKSRCQRYDFKSIDDISMKNRLEYIAQQEDISADNEAISYIVKHAAGGLRNAINLFEQLVKNKTISFTDIQKNLGATSEQTLESFYEKLLSSDVSVLSDFSELEKEGKNIKLFFRDLLFFIKSSLISEIEKGTVNVKGIQILKVLDDTYAKTKNSLDDGLTLTSGLLQIFTIGKISNQIQESPTPPAKPAAKKVEKGLSTTELEGIFQQNLSSNKTDEKLQNSQNSDGFDKTLLIQTLQKNTAPAHIITSLRESDIHIGDTTLTITPKNKMAKIALDKNENVAIIQNSLHMIGMGGYSISFS